MRMPYTRVTRIVAMTFLVAAVGACGLPRSGPSKSEILDTEIGLNGTTHIVPVDDRVTRAVTQGPASVFPRAFIGATPVAPDLIRPGDTLSFTVYENVDDGLLARGSNAAPLSSIQVDDAGFIFLPYAGRIRAAGNTPERLRQLITERLDAQTPEPQVVVQRAPGDGATVSVVGGVAGQGVYPLQRSNRTLTQMLATAGGIAVPPEVARVIVMRGSHKGEMWFEDIYDHPKYDIALSAGDRILVERDTRAFTALGATGAQRRVLFETQELSALEAIAQAGGLSSAAADPTGIFVMRDEEPAIANKVLGRADLTAPQRMVYVLNLTESNGIFLARDFDIRDGDTVYVTEAPFVQWTKTLNAITGTAGTVQTLESIGGNN